MSFIVGKKRPGKSGTLTYYYLVEGYRENGKVKQRVLKYLGTSPFQTSFDVEPEVALELAKILSDPTTLKADIEGILEGLKIHPPPGEIKDIEVIFSPGQKNPVVNIICSSKPTS